LSAAVAALWLPRHVCSGGAGSTAAERFTLERLVKWPAALAGVVARDMCRLSAVDSFLVAQP
jgi:hypothetical protein